MSDAVDEHWLDGWVGRGHAPGCSGDVQVVVMGLADSDGTWQVRVEDGVVVEVAPGVPAKPDLTLTLPAPLAGEVAAGGTTVSAAFMQGRMKTAGDLGLVLDVLSAVDARS